MVLILDVSPFSRGPVLSGSSRKSSRVYAFGAYAKLFSAPVVLGKFLKEWVNSLEP